MIQSCLARFDKCFGILVHLDLATLDSTVELNLSFAN